MRKAIKFSSISAFLLLLAPIALAAQQPTPTAPQLPPGAEELITEMQEIQAQLMPIQQQVMQDAEIRSAQEALGARIQAAMIELEPATAERISRLEALVAEAQAAETARDEAKFGEIVAEGQQIEQQLQATQQQALERPEVSEQLETLQETVQKKLVEADPQAEGLLERLEELDLRLAMLLGQNP